MSHPLQFHPRCCTAGGKDPTVAESAATQQPNPFEFATFFWLRSDVDGGVVNLNRTRRNGPLRTFVLPPTQFPSLFTAKGALRGCPSGRFHA